MSGNEFGPSIRPSDVVRRMLFVNTFAGASLVVGGCTPEVPPLIGGETAVFRLSLTPTPPNLSPEGFALAYEVIDDIAVAINLADPVEWWHAQGRTAAQSKATADYNFQGPFLEATDLDAFVQMDPYITRTGPIPNLPASISTNSFADPVLREAFIAEALNRVDIYNPRYLALGMEINAYYNENPDDFENFVTLFNETREAVKAVAPDCLVFVTFQYELLLGGFDAILGRETSEPQWFLFDMFDQQDAAAISSYPLRNLVEGSGGSGLSIPADYYTQIAEHTDKPIIIAELGWPSDPVYGGSQEDQAEFIRSLPERFGDLDIELVNWYFLYDTVFFGPQFSSMGLFDIFGGAKPSLQAWLDL